MLSEKERAYLIAYSYDYKYVARDKSDRLSVFSVKPKKCNEFWEFNKKSQCIDYHILKFIKWADKEPYKIKDILKGDKQECIEKLNYYQSLLKRLEMTPNA